MTEPEKTYIITFRHDTPGPEGWQEKLSQTPGIKVLTTSSRQARITANPATIQSAIASLGEGAIVEEELPRYF